MRMRRRDPQGDPDGGAGGRGTDQLSIPAFHDHGWVFYMSAHKAHFNLSCPPPSAAVEALAEELSGYKMTKSAVPFPTSKPISSPHDRGANPRQCGQRSEEKEGCVRQVLQIAAGHGG